MAETFYGPWQIKVTNAWGLTSFVVPMVRLECVCQDEATNPIPNPNPFDFTVPHGPGR